MGVARPRRRKTEAVLLHRRGREEKVSRSQLEKKGENDGRNAPSPLQNLLNERLLLVHRMYERVRRLLMTRQQPSEDPDALLRVLNATPLSFDDCRARRR